MSIHKVLKRICVITLQIIHHLLMISSDAWEMTPSFTYFVLNVIMKNLTFLWVNCEQVPTVRILQ